MTMKKMNMISMDMDRISSITESNLQKKTIMRMSSMITNMRDNIDRSFKENRTSTHRMKMMTLHPQRKSKITNNQKLNKMNLKKMMI